jgi:O-antigen/teichoic acid export membrane protein
MGIFKKLASETAIYGLSSIVGRFLNYLLVPFYTYHFSAAEYGVVSEFYAYAGFFSVLLVCGFETGYFRFRDKDDGNKDATYSTALIFIVLLNLIFYAAVVVLTPELAHTLHYAEHPEYIQWFAILLALDASAAIPFARLRAERKALRFASIKLVEISITIALSLFFIAYCPVLSEQNPTSPLLYFYQPSIGLGYVFIANLTASGIKFLLLLPQFSSLLWGFSLPIFIRLSRYSLPMAVVGFAGVINEMLDRTLLKYLLPYSLEINMQQLGIYSACYKLSILMTLFIQAFRYAAEPFFFNYADATDAKKVYATVLTYFVMFCMFIFLVITLFLNVFHYFIGEEYRSGLVVVPILLLANVFLGIYINLSIWYKLTNKTLLGASIAVLGALLTISLNSWWIPLFGYVGSAWATLACYLSMTLISYFLGQKHYPVAYEIKRISSIIALGVGLVLAKKFVLLDSPYADWQLSVALLTIFLLTMMLLEKRRWSKP